MALLHLITGIQSIIKNACNQDTVCAWKRPGEVSMQTEHSRLLLQQLEDLKRLRTCGQHVYVHHWQDCNLAISYIPKHKNTQRNSSIQRNRFEIGNIRFSRVLQLIVSSLLSSLMSKHVNVFHIGRLLIGVRLANNLLSFFVFGVVVISCLGSSLASGHLGWGC